MRHLISLFTMPAIMQNKSHRIIFLDGIRGWGALFVVLYHVYIEIYPISSEAKDVMAQIFIFNGMLAVVLFFIVSGYSLSIGFLQTGEIEKLKRIAIGRYFRLSIPILLSCLLVYICTKVGLSPEFKATATSQNLPNLFRFALYDVYFNYNYGSTPIPPLWTMQFELIGSGLVLATLAVFRRSWRFGAYVLLTAVLYTIEPLYATFIVGVMLAEAHLNITSTRVSSMLSKVASFGLVPALLAAAWLPGQPDLRIWVLVGSVLAFCLIHSSTSRVFLSSPVSIFLGKISFPLYLLHAPVIWALGRPLLAKASSPLEIALADACTVIAAILIAWLFQKIDTAGIVFARVIGRFPRQKVAPQEKDNAASKWTSVG
jgi:peptidoglycan/LPS O-acetylase OafA/YrhL